MPKSCRRDALRVVKPFVPALTRQHLAWFKPSHRRGAQDHPAQPDGPGGSRCAGSRGSGVVLEEDIVTESVACVRERGRLLLPGALIVAVAAAIVCLPLPADAQALYGSLTGAISDSRGAAVPGATVTIKDENTGLELNGVSGRNRHLYDSKHYQWNLHPESRTAGLKEFVQTGIPITAGCDRPHQRQARGRHVERVGYVTTEAVLLKTDKADVSTDLRPEDVTNLPLNQYRNYQDLMNLVPGATPPEFQNAQTDTPARSLSVNVNGTNRNNNVTRIDGAVEHQRVAAASRRLRRAGRND